MVPDYAQQPERPTRASQPTHRTIRVAQRITLPPQSETVVLARVDDAGTFFVQPDDRLYLRHRALVSNGIVEVRTNVPFPVIVANFATHPVTLHKRHALGAAVPHCPQDEVCAVEGNQGSCREQDACPDGNDSPVDASTCPSVEDIDLGHVPEDMRESVRNMLRTHESMWSGHLGEIKAAPHRIEIRAGANPVQAHPYRAGPAARRVEQEMVQGMLHDGVIEPARSEWASPVVLVRKQDNSLRFCVDYRRLNAITVKDTYPLPRMDECLDSLGDANVFTTLDCNSGYWQIPVAPEDRDKTTFTCHAGTYRFVRMPFGLCNAPATFQRTVDILLAGYRWKTCLVYLDDIIVFSKDVETHIRHVDEVLTVLRGAGLSLKLRKCHFFVKSVDYLGHVIRPGLLQVAEKNVDAVRQATPPRTQRQLRSFLGLCNVYRRFVKNFAHVAAPLTALTKKEQSFELSPFTEAQMEAFETLKQCLTTAPILRLPRADLPFSVDTDASDYQVGCALMQLHEDNVRYPVGYWSRTLSPAEKNYSASERECLAVVWALRILRPYLERTRFMVYTDHEALKWLLNLGDGEAHGRLARWRLRLAEFDFEVAYKKGAKNTIADALSRLATEGDTPSPYPEDDLPGYAREQPEGNPAQTPPAAQHRRPGEILTLAGSPQLSTISMEEIIKEQAEDAFCSQKRAELDSFHDGNHSRFSVNEDGILVRESPLDAVRQIVIPKSLRPRLLHLQHVPPLAGHPGGRRMYATMRQHFYWPLMAADTYNFVRQCQECAKERISHRKHASYLKLFPARAPLESVAIDILGPLPITSSGHRFLLVITDRYTKLTKTVPMRSITALVVAKAFCEHWVFVYGPPVTLLSDNGRQFVAKFFQAVCRILGTRNVFTTAYHPQTNGQTERFNRTLKSALRRYVAEHQKDWDLYSSALTFGYNTQTHSSTGFAPFDLVLSRTPAPVGIQNTPCVQGVQPRELKDRFLQHLRGMMHRASQTLQRSQERYKRNYDARVVPRPMPDVNTYVYLRNDGVANTANAGQNEHETMLASSKLRPRARGPYRILETSPETNSVIILREDEKEERVSLDRVIPAPMRRHAQLRANADPETPASATSRTATRDTGTAGPTTQAPRPCNNTVAQGPNGTAPADPQPAQPQTAEATNAGNDEYPMDRIVAHGYDDSNQLLFQVRWTGYGPDDDTWESSNNIPRNTVVAYCKRTGIPIPPRPTNP